MTSLAGVIGITIIATRLIPLNATTVGFAYLILVLLIASTWGFTEAAFASVAATFVFNFFFFPPVGTLTIADPQNWIALFSFLTTSLVASRLSTKARQRARDALDRQQDVERLYSFSRALLLIESGDSFPKQLLLKLADVFQLNAAVLYDRRSGQFFRAGPSEFEGLDEQLRDAALRGTSYSDSERNRVITAVRLGSDPVGSLAIQGTHTPDAVLQGIANLVAIGLERARAQELAHEIEATRQSEQLRTTLIDAMAHEFKTPLTSIRAATTSLLSSPEQPVETRTELLQVADEEAQHLGTLIEDAIEMARLDTSNIEVQLEQVSVPEVVRDVLHSMEKQIDRRPVEVHVAGEGAVVAADPRLIRLAMKQLIDNALKYSSPGAVVTIDLRQAEAAAIIEVTDHGAGIAPNERARIFDRFWRSPSVKTRMPGSGLGLSIAHAIARAHNGDLTVESRPGETTFRLSLPPAARGARP